MTNDDGINAPGLNEVIDPNADPLLGPPVYGRWHAARSIVARGVAKWLDQLNLDPRSRTVAAFGTRVIQEHQEALMAAAWDQAAELQRANQRMRQLQLSLVVGTSLPPFHIYPNGAQVIIWWNSTNSILQEKTNLSAAIAWSDSGRPVTQSNGSNSVTISPPTGNNFFRLRGGP